MATGKDIIDMLNLDYQSNKDIEPKTLRDPFSNKPITEDDLQKAQINAELEKANDEATSPFQESKEDLAKKQLEEQAERTVAGQVAKELSPQEQLIENMNKIKSEYKTKLDEDKADAKKRRLIANLIQLAGASAQADIQRKVGVDTGFKAVEPMKVETERKDIMKERDFMLKSLQDQLKSLQLTPYQQAQLEESKKDRELKEKLAKIKASKTKTEPTFEQKEEKKAEIKFNNELKKENREMRKEAEKSLSDIDQQIENVKRANELLAKAEGTYLADTGPIDQFLSPMGKEGQELRQALNDLSLDKMTKMFKNMSKAIDSDAERKFFQQSQVSMGNYPSVNRKILQDMLKNLQSLKAKNKEVVSSYDKKGNEIQANEVRRKTKDGKIAIFDAETKEFLRYE